MDTLDVTEAAALLHLHPKHVQRLARAGKLPATRVGRKWLFPRRQLEALLDGRAAQEPALALSARNQLRGRIARIEGDGLMAEITLRVGDQELTAVITRGSAERLRLKVGQEALAIFKATEVMIGRR